MPPGGGEVSRPRRPRSDAGRATGGGLRRLPQRAARARRRQPGQALASCGTCHGTVATRAARQPARRGGGARRQAGADLHHLPRLARHPAAQGSDLAGRGDERPAALRPLPQGGHARSRCTATSRRRTSSSTTPTRSTAKGLFQKGLTVTAVCTSCHTAHVILPHTDPQVDASTPRTSSRHLHRSATAQIEQVHRKVIEGQLWEEAAAPDPGLRRLPPAAQGAQGLLRRRHGEQGLPDLPRQAGPRRVARRRGRSRSSSTPDALRRLDPRQDRLRPVPHARSAPSHDAPLRDDHAQGRLQRLPRRAGRPVPDEHPRHSSPPRATRTRRAASTATRHHATKSKRSPTSPTFARNVPTALRPLPPRRRAGRGAHPRRRAGHRRQLRRLDPRPGADRERAGGHRHLRQLPLARTASCRRPTRRSTVNRGEPAEHLRHSATTASRRRSRRASTPPANRRTASELPVCEDCHTSHNDPPHRRRPASAP